AGKEFEIAGRGGHVVFGLPQWISHVKALQRSELGTAIPQQARQLVEDSDAPHWRKPGPPTGECRAGGRHRGIDVGLVTQRDLGESLTSGWVDRIERRCGCRPASLSGD